MTGISDERVEMQGRPREIDIEASLGSTAIEYNTSQQQVTLRATRSEPARETQKEEVHVLQSPINLGLAFYTDFRASHVKEGKPAQCVFICWGDTLVKQMIDVPVTYKDSDKNVYKKMRKSWFAVRGRWRRYFPLYDVKCVREVKFRFLRRREHHFEVLVKDTLDRVEHLRTLQEAQAAAKRLAPDPMAEPTCYFDSECQKYVHEYDRCCEYTDENDFEHPNRLNFCPQRDLDYAQRVLASFEMQPLLTLCFHDPEYAVEHSTLRRVSDDVYEDSYENSCILNYDAIFHTAIRDPQPRIVNLELEALFLEEGWIVPQCRATAAGAILSMTVVVICWKLYTGDWNIAFAAGSLLAGTISAVMIAKA